MVSKISSLRKITFGFLLCVITVSVLADDADLVSPNQNSPDQKSLDTIVVTGTSTAAPLSEVIGSVDSVDHDTLMLVQHSHIIEAADRMAGVWISRGNGQEHLTAIRSPVFTGPGSCGEFVVLEDGIPTRPAGFCNVNQLFEINSEQADRIEILKGPGSALYGGNAIHGVINVLSPAIAPQEQTSVMLDGGPHDYARAFLSYSDGKNIRINAHGDHDGGYIDNSGFDQQKLNVKFVGQLDNKRVENFIEMTNLNQETAGYIVGQDAYKDDQLRTTNPNPEAFRDAQSIHGYSKWIMNEGESREFQITPYANTSSMEFIQHYTPQEPLEKNGAESVGVNGKFSYPLPNVSPQVLAMHSGFNVETSRVYVDEYQSKPTLGKYTQGQHYDFDVFMNSLALSSEIEYHVVPSVKFLVGARYQHDYYNYTNKVNPIPLPTVSWFTPPPSRDDDFGNWGFNAGTLWTWSDQQEMYINASSGFRAPQVAELYRLQGGQPDHSVDPEKIKSVEVGWRGEITPRMGRKLFYDVAIFDMEKNNVIMQDSSKQYLGDGTTSHRGIEVTGNYWMTEQTYVRLAATYAEHRYDHIDRPLYPLIPGSIDGKTIDTAPRHYGSLQLGHEYHWGLTELEVVHMGDYYLDPQHQFQYSGHNLLNWRTEWNAAPDLRFNARLLNVLNTDYAERADVTVKTPSSPEVPRYFVGEPRSLYISVEKTFN